MSLKPKKLFSSIMKAGGLSTSSKDKEKEKEKESAMSNKSNNTNTTRPSMEHDDSSASGTHQYDITASHHHDKAAEQSYVDASLQYYNTSDLPLFVETDETISKINQFVKKLNSNVKWHKKAKETIYGAASMFKSLVTLDTSKLSSNKDKEIRKDAETYLIKVNMLETSLREFVESTDTSMTSLVLQATTIQMRLVSCLNFQQSLLPEINRKLDASREVLDQISLLVVEIKSMLSFDQDLVQLKGLESDGYIPWALRNSNNGIGSNNDNNNNSNEATKNIGNFDSIDAQNRLRKLEKAKRYAALFVSQYSHQKSIHEDLVSGGRRSLGTIGGYIDKANKIHKSMSSSSTSSNNNNNTSNSNNTFVLTPGVKGDKMMVFENISVPFYDHSQCHDCECVLTMCEECCLHLAAEVNRLAEVQRRLETISRLRGVLSDVVTSNDNIDGSSSHGSNNNNNNNNNAVDINNSLEINNSTKNDSENESDSD